MKRPETKITYSTNERNYSMWHISISGGYENLVVAPQWEFFSKEELEINAGKLTQIDQMFDQTPTAICCAVEDYNAIVPFYGNEDD